MNQRDLKAARQLKQKTAKSAPSSTPPSATVADRQDAVANHATALTSDESVLSKFIDQISSQLGQPIGDRIAATSLLKGAKLGDAILSGNAEPGELTQAAMSMVFGEIAAIGTALNSWEQFNLPKSYCLPQPLPMLALSGSNPESESYLD